MCRLIISQEMENSTNADHIDISLVQSTGINASKASGNDQNGQSEMDKTSKKNINTQEEEDQLPAELENVLHLSTTSGSDANSVSQQQAHSNNTTTSEGSLTSSPQSTIEHTQTHANQHQAINHLDLDPSLELHDSNDHHHHHHHHDQNMHAVHSDASLNDSNSCNSSTNMFGNMLLNGGTPDECGSAPFFLSSKSAWQASSSSTLEEPTSFFSSSIVNDSLTPDLSLMSSTSMSKSTPSLHAENAHDQRTLSFLNESNHMHSNMEAAANFHQVASDHHHNAALLMSDSEYAHFHGSNMHSFSSFLAASPNSCLPASEKANHHVDFLGTGDGNDTGHECSGAMFQHQMHNYNLQQHVGDVDHAAFLQYQSAQSWHNALQQEGTEGAYACYLGPSTQGMIPVMQGGTHTSNYMLNAMELQQAAEQYYNAHQEAGHRHLTHSHSLPLSLDQFGSTQQSRLMENQRIETALNGGAGGAHEGFGSSTLMAASNFRGGVRNQMNRKRKEHASSGSSAMEVGEDHGPWAHNEGHTANAASWRASHHVIKGMTRHSNKRPSPEGEDQEESLHESAPPLKRSASWDCIGLSRSNSSPLGSGAVVEHPHMMNMQLCNNAGIAPPFNLNMKSNTVPSHQNTKQDKPRARQGIANDPQSIAARHRRERISERLKILQQLVPNGSKVDLVTMLEKAINYVKFLQLQVKVLATDEYWPTPLNKFPKVAAMAKLAADSKEPANLEKVEKALAETIQANSN